MNTPRLTVAVTITGAIALGITCLSSTEGLEAPSATEEVT